MKHRMVGTLGALGLSLILGALSFARAQELGEDEPVAVTEEAPKADSEIVRLSTGEAPTVADESSENKDSDGKEPKKETKRSQVYKKRDVIPYIAFGPAGRVMKSEQNAGAGGFIGGGVYAYGGLYQAKVAVAPSISEQESGVARPGENFSAGIEIQRGGYQFCGTEGAGKYMCFHLAGDGKLEANAQTGSGQAGVGYYMGPMLRFATEDGSTEFRVSPSFGGQVLHTGTLLQDAASQTFELNGQQVTVPGGTQSLTIAGLSPFTQLTAAFESPYFTAVANGGYTFDVLEDNNVRGLVQANGTFILNPFEVGPIDMGIFAQGSVVADVQSVEKPGYTVQDKLPYDLSAQAGMVVTFGRKETQKSKRSIDSYTNDEEVVHAESLK